MYTKIDLLNAYLAGMAYEQLMSEARYSWRNGLNGFIGAQKFSAPVGEVSEKTLTQAEWDLRTKQIEKFKELLK